MSYNGVAKVLAGDAEALGSGSGVCPDDPADERIV